MDIAERTEKTELGQIAISGTEKPAGSTYAIPLVSKRPHFPQVDKPDSGLSQAAHTSLLVHGASFLCPRHPGRGEQRQLVPAARAGGPGELLLREGGAPRSWTLLWPQLSPLEMVSGFSSPNIPKVPWPLPASSSGSVKTSLGNFGTTKREFQWC